MATTSSRESRRRKILERGSDRLAFITGQLQNLPPQSPHQPHTETETPPPSDFRHQDPPLSFSTQATVSPFPHDKASGFDADQSHSSAYNGGIVEDSISQGGVEPSHDKASGPELIKHDPSFDADQSHTSAYNGGIGEGSIEPSNDPALDASGEPNSLPESLDDQSSFNSTSRVVQHSETRSGHRNLFTPKQISSAIDASQKTRLLCSVVVAVLVVLSHLGFPLLGNRFLGTTISFRPLYFVLLTNVTMVIARLLFSDRRSSQSSIGGGGENRVDDNNWAEQLSKTLEVGLVAQKVIDAVFMDFSVYAIIVICGLSFT
ncbi:hypothetical protein PTKIN_Ptkin19aG0112900 [Pterospermum kingtungense]